jgi:hypothetical protein
MNAITIFLFIVFVLSVVFLPVDEEAGSCGGSGGRSVFFACCLLADLDVSISAVNFWNQETEELKIDLLITEYS